MTRDPRLLWVHPGRIELREPCEVFPDAGEETLTVVVTAYDSERLAETIRSLATQRYRNFVVIVAGLAPAQADRIKAVVGGYTRFMPNIKLFLTKSAGWEADGLNAVLPLIETDYWCWVRGGDVVHSNALDLVARAIGHGHADYYNTRQLTLSSRQLAWPHAPDIAPPSLDRLWAGWTFPYGALITYSTAAVVEVKGFVSYDHYPSDTAWIMAYKLAHAGKTFEHINAAAYFERLRPSKQKELVKPEQYRRSLVLTHWPEHYVEEPSEE